MSLLMDALKKAELAKRQGNASDAPSDDLQSDLSLEPLQEAPPTSPETIIDEKGAQPPLSLSSHLEELDARFLEEAAAAARQIPSSSITQPRIEPVLAAPPSTEPAPRPIIADVSRHPPADPSGDQGKSAAQNLFAAKKPENQQNRKTFAITVGILTVVSVVGIAGYFWWQLQPKGSLAVRSVPPPSSVQPPVPPAAPVAPVAAAVSPQSAAIPVPTPAAPPVALPPSAPGALASPTPPSPATQPMAAADKAPAQGSNAARTKRAPLPIEPDDDNPVRISRQPLRLDPGLSRAYDAFNRGELAFAQAEYEKVRKNDPRNTDALHGLAAIALRQGQFERAEFIYRQIAEADPQDTVALAALLNQRGQVDPNTTESRLKSLAATQPDNAAPHFSLGNLYARLGRWGEAQHAYFNAHNAEPENPDIMYNLAVSLEHIRQPKLAAKFYAQALAAAELRAAGFDRAQAAARLKSLQP